MIVPLVIVCLTVLALAWIAARAAGARDRSRAQIARETGAHDRAVARAADALAGVVADLSETTATLGEALDALDRHARPSGPSRVGQRVTVHTKKPDDQTVFGVVVGDYADRLSLEDAQYVTAGGGEPLPGRQDVRVQDIAWIDVHGDVIGSNAPTEVS